MKLEMERRLSSLRKGLILMKSQHLKTLDVYETIRDISAHIGKKGYQGWKKEG